MDLKTPLAGISGIGPAYISRLQILGLSNIEDLIHHYPFRYDDFSSSSSISETKVGEKITIQGEIWSIDNVYTRTRKVLTRALLNDGSGTIELIWFHQPWLTKNIKAGDKIQASGKVNRKGSKVSLVAPAWEKIDGLQVTPTNNQPIHTGRLVPIYPETYGLSSKWFRLKISKILPTTLPLVEDPLPSEIKENMLPLKEALEEIHFPQDFEKVKKAKYRLSFDELFFIQLATQKKRLDWQKKETTKGFVIDEKKVEKFIKSLPFTLTSAQNRVIQEIIQDLKKEHPMNRLVQGEVGSGKTVVAAVILYLAYLNNLQSVVMAPTEILAFQHHQTLTKLLEPLGIEVGIYTGSRKFTKDHKSEPQVIVGTHALLSDKIDLKKVGLVVVDEQQRFGVEQRGVIRTKASSPHFLTMTATPIPRTVALTLYGDLDLSVIDELPKGRKEVKTHFVPQRKRADAYQFIKGEIKKGHQIYIVTPLIEESETLQSAKAAKVEFERLKKDIFPEYKLGLLHGKLKSKEKEEVINLFKNHEIDILVSTSVVEVGVDVPNATVMVIEGGERFGLAQLHQLRGRVGRGEDQSYNFLFTGEESPQVINRLKNLERTHDGLKLAELDLQIRGSGEIFGTLQSGRWNLKIASLSDIKLLEQTRASATKILAFSPNLDKYPLLQAKLTIAEDIIFPD